MIIDPTGKYVVTPDLGGDVCRVWSFDKKSIAPIAEAGTLKAPAGAGPRHGFFRKMKNGDTFFFFNGELNQKIYSYRVKYERASLSFKKAFEITSLNATFPSNTAPISEIAMSVSAVSNTMLQLLTFLLARQSVLGCFEPGEVFRYVPSGRVWAFRYAYDFLYQ